MSRNSVRPLVDETPPPPPRYITHDIQRNAYEMRECNGSSKQIISKPSGGLTRNTPTADSMDVCQHFTSDVGDTSLHMTYYYAMSPLLNFMKIMGLWHSEVIIINQPRVNLTRIMNSRNYSILVLIFLWVNCLRFIPAFFVGPELDSKRLFFKVIYLVVLLQASLNASVNFWAASRKNMLRKYFVHFEKSIQRDPDNKLDLDWLRRKSKIFTVIAIAYMAFHVLNQTIGVFGPVESIRNATNIFVAPFYPNMGWHILCIYMNTYVFASWIFPLLFFLMKCQLMSRLFQSFDERFGEAVRRATLSKVFPPDFEKLRRQHQHLCEAVDLANEGLFTYINVVTYLTMGPLACFMLYQLLFSETIVGNISAYLMYAIWLTSIFIDVCVVSWYAAVMSSKAHKPREKCYVCVVNNVTNEQQMQMSMFLSRLSEDIGFTIFDLVTITKPFILTIGGLVLTYYAIISEFQQ